MSLMTSGRCQAALPANNASQHGDEAVGDAIGDGLSFRNQKKAKRDCDKSGYWKPKTQLLIEFVLSLAFPSEGSPVIPALPL